MYRATSEALSGHGSPERVRAVALDERVPLGIEDGWQPDISALAQNRTHKALTEVLRARPPASTWLGLSNCWVRVSCTKKVTGPGAGVEAILARYA